MEAYRSFTGEVQNLYDSHVHWRGTGAQAACWNLSKISGPRDLESVKIESRYRRGDWLLGYCWDESTWDEPVGPHRTQLDKIFGSQLVRLMRADYHAAWVSTEALKRAGLYYQNPQQPEGGRIELDPTGWPTGVLVDQAMKPIEDLIPKESPLEMKFQLEVGAHAFNQAGFTHIRDLSGDEVEWNLKCELYDSGALNLAVEQHFHAHAAGDFHKALELSIRSQKNPRQLLRPLGPKIYLDGALGSEGAFLSQNYPSGHRGVLLLERIALKEMIRETWANGLDIAVHCIGDEATHIICSVAGELWGVGEVGRLHIEHCQMLRPESLAKVKGQDVVFHLQPCHWLTDKTWLKIKTGKLFPHVFPWALLESAGQDFYFGSDSPIEPPSLIRNLQALEDAAAAGVSPLVGAAVSRHSHPDTKWIPNTYTRFDHGQVQEVIFRGQSLLA